MFFGTPGFAVPSLEAIAASRHPVVAVVTQPDRPRGRGQKVSGSPVKISAERLSIPILQPDRLRAPEFLEALRERSPDLGVVAAYGKILPAELLALPRVGMINVHASLLPRWRGAAPIHRAILAGDAVTGITIMQVVQALDAGPILSVAETPIGPTDTSASLERRLAVMGADLIVRAIDDIEAGRSAPTPQDESRVTYAKRLARADGQIDFAKSADDVHNAIRGLQPWPLVSVNLDGKRLLLHESESRPDERTDAAPGTIVRVDPDALVVATGRGVVLIRRVQLEGRPPVAVRDFLHGHQVRPGAVLQ